MKNIVLALATMAVLTGCAGAGIPANFNERATSELKIDIKLFSQAVYLPEAYGFSPRLGAYPPQKGVLVCSDDRVLFVRVGREKYDAVVEINYSDVIDVLVPAWIANRLLVVKCKSEYHTFQVIRGASVDREMTYNFYRFIATKAGIGIKIPERKTEKPDLRKAQTDRRLSWHYRAKMLETESFNKDCVL